MPRNDAYDEKLISLLRFALFRSNVDKNAYFIGQSGDEKKQNDKLCLLRSKNDSWLVFYTERGMMSQRTEHSSIGDAATDFFWRLTRKDTQWMFREAWEKETGQSF